MAKKTSLPSGFTSKTNYQTLSGIPATQKVNAISEWNLGIQDLADSIDDNYERLILNWTNDISVDQVLALGQYVDYNDVVYRVTTSYDVSDPKTFTSGNFQELSYDYKSWYVDGDNGSNSNKGGINDPVLTAQKAIDLRELDGATTGEIVIIGGITSGIATIASNPTKSTIITGGQRGIILTTLNVTDTSLRLVDMIVLTLNITQTSTNNIQVVTYNAQIFDFNDTVATVGNSVVFALNASRFTVGVGIAENFDTIFHIEDNSSLTMSGSSGSTWNEISLLNRGTLSLGASSPTIDTLNASASFIIISSSVIVTITTAFTHTGVVFTNYDNIDASGATETEITGQFSNSLNNTITSITSGELLKWDGSEWINNTLAQAGIAATIHSHTSSSHTILNAAVLTLNTTPVQILGAAGTDSIWSLQTILVKHEFLTSAFATNTTLQIGIGTSSATAVYIDLATSVLTSTSDQTDMEQLGPFVNIVSNSRVYIRTKTGDPTAGSGSLLVKLVYQKMENL